MLEQIMRQHPDLGQYTGFYLKPQDAGNLTPEAIELMRMYTGVNDATRKWAKQQREQIGIRQ